jgi:hypothetical protein
MASLVEGEDGVVSIDTTVVTPGWTYATTHTYHNGMIKWCLNHGQGYGVDYVFQTYRLENHQRNSHRWYFKDPEVATLFSIMFS